MSSSSYAETVSQSIIQQLKEGTAPWVQSWEPGQTYRPYNAFTGNSYRGFNALWLMSEKINKGYGDNRWLTYNQARQVDAQVNKGEKSTTIQYWKWDQEITKLDSDRKPLRNEAGDILKTKLPLAQPHVFYAKVFNAEQISGLEKEAPRLLFNEPERHEQAEKLLNQSQAHIVFENGNRAFYRPSTDTIVLPERGQFKSTDAFYATAFHELAHWSGHESRLNRDLSNPYGSIAYAKEELRAEVASLMFGEQLEIGHDLGQHAAYIDSWIHLLENDHREIFRAAADAEKIIDYVIPEIELSQQLERETESLEKESVSIAVSPESLLQDEAPSFAPEIGQAIQQALPKEITDDEDENTPIPQQDSPDIEETPTVKAWVPPFELPDGKVRNGETHYHLKDFSIIRSNDNGVFVDKITDIAIVGAMTLAVQQYPDQAIQVTGTEEFKGRAAKFAGKHGIPIIFSDERLNSLVLKDKPPAFSKEHSITPPAEAVAQTLDTSSTLENLPGQSNPETEKSVDHSHPPTQETVTASRIYLAVPYSDKDDARKLGAKWDKQAQSWYINSNQNRYAFSKWSLQTQFENQVQANPHESFAKALQEAGLVLQGPPIMDGKRHRVQVQDDKSGQLSGSYIGYTDGHPAGYFKNFKTGETGNWKFDGRIKALSERDKAQLLAESVQRRSLRENELITKHKETAQLIEAFWNKATEAKEHPYLTNKGVASYGLRIDSAGPLKLDDQRWSKPGNLIVPIQDMEGKILSALSIDENGVKRLAKGGQKHGGHFILGNIEKDSTILFAEGYSTAATLHELTGKPVVVTIDSGNLPVVAEAYRAKYPDKMLVIAGDNDHNKSIYKNVGLKKALETAKAANGHLLIPKFDATASGSDWNDLAKIRGKESVKQTLQVGISLAESKEKVRLAAKAQEQIPQQSPPQQAKKREKTMSLSR